MKNASAKCNVTTIRSKCRDQPFARDPFSISLDQGGREIERTDDINRLALPSFVLCKNSIVPNRGIASETWGRVSATRFRNTVSDSKMVTPETIVAHLCSMIRSRSSRAGRSRLPRQPIVDRRRPALAPPQFSPSIVPGRSDDVEKSTGAEPRRRRRRRTTIGDREDLSFSSRNSASRRNGIKGRREKERSIFRTCRAQAFEIEAANSSRVGNLTGAVSFPAVSSTTLSR